MPRLTKAQKQTQKISEYLNAVGFDYLEVDRFKTFKVLYMPQNHMDYLVLGDDKTAYVFNLNLWRPVYVERHLSDFKRVSKGECVNADEWPKETWTPERIAASILWYGNYSLD